MYAIAVLGNNAVLGLLGEMNLSSGVSMALGAYAFCYFANDGMGVVAAAVAAVALSTALAAIVAIPTTRLQGIFTALATFALAYAIPTLAIYMKEYTGGDEGTPAPFDFEIFGQLVSGSTTGMLVAALVVFAVLAAASLLMLNAAPGRAALMVGESELAGVTNGFNPRVIKVLVWTWAGFAGAVAGVLYALTVGFIGPTGFGFMLGVWILVGGVVAGARSAWGALLGGLFVGLVPVELQSYVPAEGTSIVFGVILLLALLAGGNGLAQWIERIGLLIKERTFGRKKVDA
ncbi:branched-chain amino acid ABC transporter permease [Nocardioides hwasunensis]|uniref:Branched-chain amino acid ABC transporter permease n=1 Tax=Nocardioides hwasunensis TaxID=397258 RepID=A0ABR8MJX3_9ACTN|nr:branched-chain amino acid ABC transporter permease [Nocardioides hwasunensis]